MTDFVLSAAHTVSAAVLTSAPASGLLHDLLHPTDLIRSLGTAATVAIIALVFAETGLLVGFFLPGDSLLFAAGLYTTTTNHQSFHLPLAILLPGVAIAAVAGAQTGYLIGRVAGDRLFRRSDSRFFKKVYVERTRFYLTKYGETKAVILARFIPVVRTFINPAVGVAKMPLRTFWLANLIGGLVWSVGVTLLGVALGKSVSNIDRYILPITALIVVVSAIPVVREVREVRKHRSSVNGSHEGPPR